MQISRMDLADAGSPDKIVTAILKEEPNLTIPVPIEELCKRLDITEFQELSSDGFEGGLITDQERSSGIILFKAAIKPRRRFTIAHELGHFLMPSHIPSQAGKFLCSRDDMRAMGIKEGTKRQRMEGEANRFASLILMPPPALRRALQTYRDPDLQQVITLAKQFEVSKEAFARSYISYREEPLAIIIAKDGIFIRYYRGIKFPYIVPNIGDAVPSGSIFHRNSHAQENLTELTECLPGNWIEVPHGSRAPVLYEQVHVQQGGFSLIMLHVEAVDEEESEYEAKLEQSWEIRFGSNRRRR